MNVLGLPVGTIFARNSLVARETNIQDILGTVAIITVETLLREAKLSERNRCLASRRLLVSIAPDTVPLNS